MICTGRHCAEHSLIRDNLWADTETAKEDARVGLIQHMSHGITGLPPMNSKPRYKR